MKYLVLFVLMVACLAWALHGMDFGSMIASIGDFRWIAMVPVFALYSTTHVLRSIRLRALVGRPIGLGSMWNMMSIGFLAIHVVPLRMGEFVRPYLLQEKEGVPFGAGLAAIFVERMLDVAMLTTLLLTVAFGVKLEPLLVDGIDVLAVAQKSAGVLLAAGTVGGTAVLFAPESVLVMTDKLPVGGLVRRFREGLHSLRARPRAAALAAVMSVGMWTGTILAVQVTLWAFGLPHTFGAAAAVWAGTSSAMTAIPTPGFFGPFEAGCSGVVRLLGAPADPARAFAILLHLGQFAFTLTTGLTALLAEGLSLRELVTRSRAARA